MSNVNITHEHIDEAESEQFGNQIREMLHIPEDKFLGFILIGVQDDEPFTNPATGALEFSPYVIRSNSHDPQHIGLTLMSVAMAMTGGTFREMSASDYREGKTDEGIDISRPEG